MSLGFSPISLALGGEREKEREAVREGGRLGDESLLFSQWLVVKWIYKHAA